MKNSNNSKKIKCLLCKKEFDVKLGVDNKPLYHRCGKCRSDLMKNNTCAWIEVTYRIQEE